MISYASSVIADSRIDIELFWTPPHVNEVRLSSSRSPEASRVFEGKPVSEAIKLLPLLFSICGHAQAVAGINAVERAVGVTVDPSTQGARLWLVRAEAAQEYLWRLLLDLPKLFRLSPAMEALAAFRQKLLRVMVSIVADKAWLQPGEGLNGPAPDSRREVAAEFHHLLESEVLGCQMVEWQTINDYPAFCDWITRNETVVGNALNRLRQQAPLSMNQIELLPAVNHASWLEEIADSLASIPHFAASPLWRGRCYETGALARCQEHPLVKSLLSAGEDVRLIRFVARMVELVESAEWFAAPEREQVQEQLVDRWLGGAAIQNRAGYGWVETARGLLIHYVELDNENVHSYRILAPTEWNFNPDGPLRRELSSVRAGDETSLLDQATLSVMALDPCVDFEVRVSHA